MYARVTTFKVDPARLHELSAKIEQMGPRAKALPGMIDAYTAWRGDGQGIIVALYNSKEDADRAVARIQALWGDLAGLVSGAPRHGTGGDLAMVGRQGLARYTHDQGDHVWIAIRPAASLVLN